MCTILCSLHTASFLFDILLDVDLSSKGIEFSKALSGVFPRRIRKVYLLNGGWLLKLITQAATLLLSKKLMYDSPSHLLSISLSFTSNTHCRDRMEIGDVSGLKNYIDDEWLLSWYLYYFPFLPFFHTPFPVPAALLPLVADSFALYNEVSSFPNLELGLKIWNLGQCWTIPPFLLQSQVRDRCKLSSAMMSPSHAFRLFRSNPLPPCALYLSLI